MVRVSLNISCTFHYVSRSCIAIVRAIQADCLARLGLALVQRCTLYCNATHIANTTSVIRQLQLQLYFRTTSCYHVAMDNLR